MRRIARVAIPLAAAASSAAAWWLAGRGAFDHWAQQAAWRSPVTFLLVRKGAQEVALVWGVLITIATAIVANWRHARVPAGVALVSIVSALAVGEIGLRLLDGDSATRRTDFYWSDRYHHVHPQSCIVAVGVHRAGKPAKQGTTEDTWMNADGFRTRYSRRSFAKAPTRVAVLGDSFTFGTTVRTRDAPAMQMQSLLRSTPGYEQAAVLNAGVLGYSPFIETRVYRDVVSQYRPQAVVLILDETDISDDWRYETEFTTNDGGHFVQPQNWLSYPSGPSVLDAIRNRVPEIFEFFNRTLVHPTSFIPEPRKRSPIPPPGPEVNPFFWYRHAPEVSRPFFERTLAHLTELDRLVRKDGGRLLVAVISRHQHWDPEGAPLSRDPTHPPFPAADSPFRDFFERAATDVPFKMFNMFPDFVRARATMSGPLVQLDDVHWTRAGAGVASAAIVRELFAAGMLVRTEPGRAVER